jgi:23S rRNA pseudouridine1911/1915/1917 synthase
MSREASFQRDLSAPIEERRFEVGAPDHGRRLDVFLAERMSWRSRARIQALIAGERVTIERGGDESPRAAGKLRAGTLVRRGNEVVVRLDSAFIDAIAVDGVGSSPSLAGAGAEEMEIEVVYEDGHLLAVNKPSPMNVYPTRRHLGGSLTELVHRRHRARGAEGSPPSPCHRLDRETSGVVLFAKDRDTRADVGRQFEERTVEKTYLALVAGLPADDEGVIDLPLGRDLTSRVEIKQGTRLDGAGSSACTRWKVRARFAAGDRALLELRPTSGRQHQLRAHLAAIGHPILGDVLYLGGDDLFLASLERPLTAAELAVVGGLDRLALHAWRLRLVHPATRQPVTVEAAPPVGLVPDPR